MTSIYHTYPNDTTWDRRHATLILDYKSGRRHLLETTVAKARYLATRERNRKSLRWAKVSIPNDDNTRALVCILDPYSGWTRKVVNLPRTLS